MWLLIIALGIVIYIIYWFYSVIEAPMAIVYGVSVLLLGSVLVGVFFEAKWQYNEHVYAQAVKNFAGNDVKVRCQRMIDLLVDTRLDIAGDVMWDSDGTLSNQANLKFEVCKNLQKWPVTDVKKADIDIIYAVEVLSHEAVHVSGVLNEAETECYAMQHYAEVAKALGVSQSQAEEAALRYANEAYSHMPSKYKDEVKCSAGGAWDLHPETNSWPTE